MSNGVVVVADDDPGIRQLVEAALVSEGFAVATVPDGQTALSEIRALRPDAAVLDVMMPNIDGITLCRQLRADPKTRGMSIILLTALVNADDQLAGLRAGADDYVTKPFDPVGLAERVKLTIQRTKGMTALSPLTGLPGNEDVRALLERLTRDAAEFALLHVDLNDFKAFNDHYGVMRGDLAIKRLAETLLTAVGESADGDAFIAHIGGDDFLVVTAPEQAEDVARQVIRRWDNEIFELYDARDALRGSITVQDRRRERHVYPLMGVSIGIATTAARSYDTHLEVADVAAEMKQVAKRSAGSGYAIDRRRASSEPSEPSRPPEEPGRLLRPLRRNKPPAGLREELQYIAAATRNVGSEQAGTRQTVVIVDDEEDVREVLRLHCELHGYPVVAEAEDGREAVRKVIEHEPVFVILDYRMPEMDGEEAAKMIRNALPSTKIIAFSGVLTSRPEWADDFLNKYQIAQISPLLGRLLETNPT